MTNATGHSTHTASNSSRKIARNIFTLLTGLNALVALGLGFMTLVNMQGVFESFDITYTSELDSLGLTSGGLFILMAVLSAISILWLVRGKLEGIVVPVGYAIFLFALGFMVLARLGQTNVLYVDSIRGFLTMVAGFFAYREMRH
jgi:hypothetical protein